MKQLILKVYKKKMENVEFAMIILQMRKIIIYQLIFVTAKVYNLYFLRKF